MEKKAKICRLLKTTEFTDCVTRKDARQECKSEMKVNDRKNDIKIDMQDIRRGRGLGPDISSHILE